MKPALLEPSAVFKESNSSEKEIFSRLQQNFAGQYEAAFPDKLAPKTIVVIPSLTLDSDILAKVEGIIHYEERLLSLLLLLRMPRTHVVYISSMPVDPVIIDYYLHLLPGITGYHARERLHLLSCYDTSPLSLTEKILSRPRLINRIRRSIPADHIAHIACFNVTKYERSLAVALNLPLYGCDPELLYWGTKSGSREIFKACGLNVPAGYENLKSEDEVASALAKLKKENPEIEKALVKINDGFSGEGNAVFSFHGISAGENLEKNILKQMKQRLTMVANDLSYETFFKKFVSMGGVVEAFMDGAVRTSPSVQCRINPLGKIDIISTHEQLMGGESGQVFTGATFPANQQYCKELASIGYKVSVALKNKGVLGRFGIDFISVKERSGWKHYAIEINLRKGGTTHPYLMLQFLTNGDYEAETGRYITASGAERFYLASDNLRDEMFKGLTPHDLMDIAMLRGLHFDGTREEGVIFHLIGALSQYGKLGVVCIGSSPRKARHLYDETVKVLKGACC